MSQVPTTNINALYTNTTTGTIISPTIMDAAVADLVATINTNDTAFGVLAAAGGIGTTNLANLSVTTAKIALLAVTAAQIANETITSAQILDGSIATSDIANLAITTAKIALLAIGAAQIANNTITTLQLATGAVTSTNILDGTILDIDINASAAIAWTKISKAASSLADLATRLASDLTGTLNAAQLPAFTGDMTTSAGSAATTLKNTGTAGTYRSVTTDAQGRVTSGTNPTTLAGYNISDAAPLTHVGLGGASQHPVASAVLEGFMSIADKTKLDGLVQTGLAGYTVPADTYITFGSRFKVGYNSTTDTLDTYET